MEVGEGGTWLEVLSAVACERHLRQEKVGRLGLVVDGDPEIFPVNYVFVDRTVVIRTDPGTKLAAATRHGSVAFEIDGVDEQRRTGWSVLVVGTAHEVTDPGERRKLLAGEAPEPWAEGEKDHIIRVEPTRISGRYLHRHPARPGQRATA